MKKERLNQNFTIPVRQGVLTFIDEIFKGENNIVYKGKRINL
jgi:hypothetical protein